MATDALQFAKYALYWNIYDNSDAFDCYDQRKVIDRAVARAEKASCKVAPPGTAHELYKLVDEMEHLLQSDGERTGSRGSDCEED